MIAEKDKQCFLFPCINILNQFIKGKGGMIDPLGIGGDRVHQIFTEGGVLHINFRCFLQGMIGLMVFHRDAPQECGTVLVLFQLGN